MRRRTTPSAQPLPVARAARAAAALAGLLLVCATPGTADAKDKAKVKVGAHVQLRAGYVPAVDDPATASDEGAEPDELGFHLRRARLSLKGKHGRFKLKGRFAFEENDPRMLTLALKMKLGAGLDLEVGQTKRLMTLAYIDSSSTRRLVERALVGDRVGGNRDVGLVLRGRWWRERLVAHLALFNGNGPNTVGNDTGRPLVEARVDWHPFGHIDTDEAEISHPLRLRVGGAVGHGSLAAARFSGGQQLSERDRSLAWSAVAVLQVRGVEARVEGLWHDRTAIPLEGITLDEVRREGGWAAQLSWQPWRQLELAARLARWDKERGDADTRRDRITAGVGWRFMGDDLKLQANWRHDRRGRAGGLRYDTSRVELQLQGRL